VFLAGHIFAMVTYCATKLTATYSAMIWQIFEFGINQYRVGGYNDPSKSVSWKVLETG